ncbi:DNA-directed RNA polymerase subunit beta [Dehalococcoidia bacterium]|nr:DNA-directed RNA polymerase subunit beta [Dehalococcoidia bacterium]
MASQLSVSHDTPQPRKSYARIPEVLEVPNLIQIQLSSYSWLKNEGIRELLDEISPIQDSPGARYELNFREYEFGEPKYAEPECRQRDKTFSVPMYVHVELEKKAGPGEGEKIEQRIFMGDLPDMTDKGTFVVNGAERVVVSQLVRSPGVYFTVDEDPASGRAMCAAKLIPNRGAWLEFETSTKGILSVKLDRKRKIPATTLLRAIGLGSDEELIATFADVDAESQYIRGTLEKEPSVRSEEEALLDFYRKLRPGELPSLDNARNLLWALFYDFRRYDLGKVGRYKLQRRLGLDIPLATRTLTRDDLIAIVKRLIKINNGREEPDDIDHLGNRRVRAVGELTQNQLRIGLLRMERVVKERMTLIDPEQATPSAFINIRPIVAAVKEFFGGSQLSQFMDQTNPLAELTHKRRLSALGPGGLSRERAGFDVRDVHHSHYGRICPIETPEGPNIGLLGSLATYAVVNPYGFIETPYRRVVKEIPNSRDDLLNRTLRETITTSNGQVVAESGSLITKEIAQRIGRLKIDSVKVKPFASQEIVYLSADQEEEYAVAQANSTLDDMMQFSDERIELRRGREFLEDSAASVDFMDVSPKQIVSVSTALIPFLEHDDANRALMGANMQRQAVPLLRPQAPLVGTGMEQRVAMDSGQVTLSPTDGVVTEANSREILIKDNAGDVHTRKLQKFVRSNQGTCINQRPIVRKGDLVKAGEPLADSSSTDHGQLALGQNVLCAFMSWEGYNFEDAIIISERLVQEDRFTSVHIEKHEVDSRDTKLGPEEITRDIPNVGEENLRDLDEEGIIRIGAQVNPGDILVGKITPKGETELTAEEKLLRAIFGEKAREVKDTSLRVPHGERGTVIDVRVFSQEDHDELSPGVNKLVRVWIAQTRKIAEGDKMAGRHGNKGVIARILPVEDMPYLPDGTPVDIILNPIGVPSRMNLGQVLETHLGWAASSLGFTVDTPVFDGARDVSIEDSLARMWLAQRSDSLVGTNGSAKILEGQATDWLNDRGFDGAKIFSDDYAGEASRVCLRLWLKEIAGINSDKLGDTELAAAARKVHQEQSLAPPIFGKSVLVDGRDGQTFDQPVTVGYIYMLKLIHLVEDKIHARSTGPYSLITQQPLGGKAQFGGQRFGEMEVWALEAYSAAYNLQEMLTVKSDDVVGRVKTYEAIVKGEDVAQPGVPESFHVLLKELQSLGLGVELLNEDEDRLTLLEDLTEEMPAYRENIDEVTTESLQRTEEE